MRYDGEYTNDPLNPDSVTFCSTPYLALREKRPHKGDSMKSILHFHYGYDVGDERDGMQIVRDGDFPPPKEILNVAQLWTLRLGAGQ